MTSVLENWQNIQEQIKLACEKSSRDPKDIHVIGVTKYVGIQRMQEALAAGIKHIGENKVQDSIPKFEILGSQATWHFIGHLQTNKVKEVVGRFSYIHSLDRHSLAKEIEKRAAAQNVVVPCFVQVNVSGETTKQGVPYDQAKEFIEQLIVYSHIRVIGLMTMAPLAEDAEDTRPVFRQLKQLQKQLQQYNWPHAPLTELSMGMSGDYHIAIEEGATFVRLGTSLVGKNDDRSK